MILQSVFLLLVAADEVPLYWVLGVPPVCTLELYPVHSQGSQYSLCHDVQNAEYAPALVIQRAWKYSTAV